MLSLLDAFKSTQTRSVRDLKSALASSRKTVTELLRTHLIHQRHLHEGGRNGAFGYPSAAVQFGSGEARRQFRGGAIQVLREKVVAIPSHQASIRFLGFRCVQESAHDQVSPKDEPYFVICVDLGNGAPLVKKFGPFEGIGIGSEIGAGDLLAKEMPPNPVALRVMAFEKDDGDPDETAKAIQDEVVKLSQEAGSLASAGEAADGPGAGATAVAGGIGGAAAGPLGALVAAGIVHALDLGDDFVGQSVKVLFERPEDVGTPDRQGRFQNNDFNCMIAVDGGKEGHYELFFDVHVKLMPVPPTV